MVETQHSFLHCNWAVLSTRCSWGIRGTNLPNYNSV